MRGGKWENEKGWGGEVGGEEKITHRSLVIESY